MSTKRIPAREQHLISSKVSITLVALSTLLAASVPVLPTISSHMITGSTGLVRFSEP